MEFHVETLRQKKLTGLYLSNRETNEKSVYHSKTVISFLGKAA